MDSISDVPLKFEESEVAELIAALSLKHIQASDEDIQKLVEKRNWIYPSGRVVRMQQELGIDSMNDLYDFFDYGHHIRSSAKLFRFMKLKKVAVIYGHKAQGKSQFLYFVFKLLEKLKEKVIFLDRTILPTRLNNPKSSEENFCANMWRDSFKENGTVTDCLDKFHENPQPQLFGQFLRAVLEDIKKSKMRVWIIIDEVVLFKDFPIDFPDEQEMGSFNWIITGSAEIGSWVNDRHLENYIFDLPLFTKTEVNSFADKLSRHLKIDLADAIAIPQEGVEDWLEERFGGVIGYVTEMFLELLQHSVGEAFVSRFMTQLESRAHQMIIKAATKRGTAEENICKSWLAQMKTDGDPWIGIRNAGLCGRECPRGIIFPTLLKAICSYIVEEDELGLVISFRNKFAGDDGLNGCLLEREEILKLKRNDSLPAASFHLNEDIWMLIERLNIPLQAGSRCIFTYDERRSSLQLNSSPHLQDSPSSLVILPSCFDVIDVVLVDRSNNPPTIYGIQITRSKKPFTNHHTLDTCSDSSKKRLDALWAAISSYLKLDRDNVKILYVMVASNCEGQDFRPPARHLNDFLFSPPPPAESETDTINMHPKRKTRRLR